MQYLFIHFKIEKKETRVLRQPNFNPLIQIDISEVEGRRKKIENY
jgi:hypothetical protein